MARRIRDLPDRSRTKSRPVINPLSKWRLDLAMVHPLVLQRPFKILVYNEHPNRKHMAELNARFAQGVDSIPTGDTVIDFPKSVAVLPPPLNYVGNVTIGVAKDRPSPTESTSRDFEQESKEASIWTKEAWVDRPCLVNLMNDYLKPVMHSL